MTDQTPGGGADLSDVRRSYERAELDPTALDRAEVTDPLLAVRRWLDEAVAAGTELEPTAMTVATVETTPAGPRPDARIVLCKDIDHGVVFYSGRTSAKGRQLATAPVAAVTFLWSSLERQVRLRGGVELVDDATSDAYFASRPRGSQLGAWSSDQSTPIADRAALEAQAAAVEERFAGSPVPRPPRWGGYRVVPVTVELWQGRPNRLHDRLRWTRVDAGWTLERLQP